MNEVNLHVVKKLALTELKNIFFLEGVNLTWQMKTLKQIDTTLIFRVAH